MVLQGGGAFVEENGGSGVVVGWVEENVVCCLIGCCCFRFEVGCMCVLWSCVFLSMPGELCFEFLFLVEVLCCVLLLGGGLGCFF